MQTRWIIGIAVVLVGGLAAWQISRNSARADEVVQPTGDSELAHPHADITTFMHAKLNHSQTVLYGLVTQDFDQIERGAEALRATSLLSPGPYSRDALDDELYEHFRLEFLRLSTDLGEMARDENLEGAAFTYNNLTANCMACHQYLKDQADGEVAANRDSLERQ